jgi:large subunit ribosomal protein L14
MIQLRSILTPADNSGAKRLMVIHVYRGAGRATGYLGCTVMAVVDRADPKGMVKDKEKVKALLVRVKKEFRRKDGSYIRFDDNAVVLLTATEELRGTRIFGPVARELRDKQFMKIVSLAPEVL